MADLVDFTGYARLRGCSRPYVSKLVAKGIIPITADRRIDPAAADAAIARARDVSKQYTADRHAAKRAEKQGLGALGASPARLRRQEAAEDRDEDESPMERFNRARAKTETFRAETAEAEYRKLIGELVELAAVRRAVFELATAGRKTLERLPDRVSARIAAALGIDARDCRLLLQSEVRELCEEEAKQAEALPENLTATKQ